ncbi:hypothetical protein [Diaminobutyricibacter sp. McL0608]|uniref:hypothetical protein n=1 Tax=Leifsonia sp. McL0608 TaxID=3143537 RepID=UPI0031F2DB44
MQSRLKGEARTRLPDVDGATGDDQVVAAIRASLEVARARLSEADARDEALAEFVPERRVMLITREARMVPVARVWRLGVLLLGASAGSGTTGAASAGLWATGSITRVLEPGRPAYQSESAERRRAYRAAALRGHFPKGETVNFDASPIDLDATALAASAGPLLLHDGRALVLWNATLGPKSATPLDAYLDDRVDLLIHPPEGA